MNSFEIERQMSLMMAMADVFEQKVKCCKKYEKFDEAQKWDQAKQKILELHG